ncbi:hypothetical protein CLAFUW4_07777 [Fulvia fulva]|nr:hypothetical protein CLAFUR4_07782 [Fulvia fulva]WPV12484.1 hypothetical protein CLAFUW4_07777 [Fulvia fulva]WPV27764.1 hypothetical protein CLAFUW7_07778 [Fulvia fulva]
MSGIEIIGVVLGAIPLVISGLEHYADGVRTIKVICGASREFKALSRKLGAEEVLYRNTLELLLSDCLDLQKHNELTREPDGVAWEDLEVKAALQGRLQEAYDSFIEHVRSVAEALDEIKGRLQIGPSGKGPFNDAKSFKQAYRRFHFALQKSAYIEFINSIKDDNTHLKRLTQQSQAINQVRQSRRMPDYDQSRLHASGVYDILQHGLQVSCATPHKASIYLQPAVVGKFQLAQRDAIDTFRIVLHHDAPSSAQKAPAWYVQEAEMRLLDVMAAAGAPIAPSCNIPGSNRKRKVQFQEPARSLSKPEPVTALQQKNVAEIQDLCNSIHTLKSQQCGICLGYLVGSANSHRHGLYWPKDRLVDQASFSVCTLASILKEPSCTRRKLNSADAHRLAIPLASGMLRLHDTPWLSPGWSKQDISLIRHNGKVLSEHAFISQNMSLPKTTPPPSSTSTDKVASLLIRNPTLFALGIILIELCMGKSIDELHEADELDANGSKNALSEYRTADRLIQMEEISDRLGSRWNDVVRRCIYCDLNQSKVSLQDRSFQQAVHSDIVGELEESYRQFFHL